MKMETLIWIFISDRQIKQCRERKVNYDAQVEECKSHRGRPNKTWHHQENEIVE